MSKPFIDSNVILYLLSDDAGKADKAESIVAAGGIISVQVLNEITSICHKKLKMDWVEIEAVLDAIKANLDIVPLTEKTHALAVQICKRYQLSFYDAHICAAAIEAGANLLLSEDMQDGMLLDDIAIKNPFNGFQKQT
ncbi:PIN domain-containing protein [Methylophilus sp. 14]|uniref:PIN domain-containing protein n=1 Tax=Methylophilus sp. 14 TaxID=2781019 RepID=UPI00188E95BA|nr:PIN domain-containing protein [Methylophilus sp. 14]